MIGCAGPSDPAYNLVLRAALDAAGFRTTMIVAYDAGDGWDIPSNTTQLAPVHVRPSSGTIYRGNLY